MKPVPTSHATCMRDKSAGDDISVHSDSSTSEALSAVGKIV